MILSLQAVGKNGLSGSFVLDFQPAKYTCKFDFESKTFTVDGKVSNLVHNETLETEDDTMNVVMVLSDHK